MPESKFQDYEKWLKEQTWENVTSVETVHQKAEELQNMSIKAMKFFFFQKKEYVSLMMINHEWTQG